jgi:hypothetical protein
VKGGSVYAFAHIHSLKIVSRPELAPTRISYTIDGQGIRNESMNT